MSGIHAKTFPLAQSKAVDAWFGEVSSYVFASPCFSQSTEHLTQLVWKGSLALGCAYASYGPSFSIPDGVFVVTVTTWCAATRLHATRWAPAKRAAAGPVSPCIHSVLRGHCESACIQRFCAHGSGPAPCILPLRAAGPRRCASARRFPR